MEFTCESIGLTKEELQERVVDGICKKLLIGYQYDSDEGGAYPIDTPFTKETKKLIAERITQTVSELAEKHVMPILSDKIENFCLQATNKWGEATSEKLTFTEYLVKRAEEYMLEKVNYDGKSKEESGGYSWSGTQTRLASLIHKHLHYSIETAMKNAMNTANSTLVKALQETAKQKLAEISEVLNVSVKVGK